MSGYHISIFYSEEDGGYIADIPDLDSCSAFGKTPGEALAEVARAKDAWLAAARQLGKPNSSTALAAGDLPSGSLMRSSLLKRDRR